MESNAHLHGAAEWLRRGGAARLSVFISPRLWSDVTGGGQLTLDKYPDLLNWPSRVSAIAWQASIDGAPALALSVDSDPLNPLKPVLWAALFNDTTRVTPFLFEDYRGTPIETIPIWSLSRDHRGPLWTGVLRPRLRCRA